MPLLQSTVNVNEWLITDAANVQQNTASELHWEPRQQEMTEDTEDVQLKRFGCLECVDIQSVNDSVWGGTLMRPYLSFLVQFLSFNLTPPSPDISYIYSLMVNVS